LKLADKLSKEVKSKLNQIQSPMKKRKKKPPSNKPKPKKEEKINWHDIMGSNRQVLKRGKGGAYRNR
jgi:hypothetical protein